jgi:hypothetical protein
MRVQAPPGEAAPSVAGAVGGAPDQPFERVTARIGMANAS